MKILPGSKIKMMGSITQIIHQVVSDKEKIARLLFSFCAWVLLLFMLQESKMAGISGDEEVHYKQSVQVYNYFASGGTDQGALQTPVSHLKFYGQSFDNLTTILIRWFNIEDIYTFRHEMNSLAGWLAIFFAALLAIWLSGYGAGILTLLLFALSPTFLGHAQNNLKDIPFALAYIAGTYYLLKWLFAEIPTWQDSAKLIAAIAFCISIRPGGLLLICYLLLFIVVREIHSFLETRQINTERIKRRMFTSGVIILFSCLAGILLWPYALQHPFTGLWESYKVMANFPTTVRQIFEGRQVWSDLMPWYYLPKMMLITIPLLVWAGLAGYVARAGKILHEAGLKYSFLIFTILFPVVFVIYEKSNLYGSWRHFLFVYPALVVLAAIGIRQTMLHARTIPRKGLVILVILVLAFDPLSFRIKNRPYDYLYYNQLVGGLKGAYGNYETDYYYHSVRQGSEWLTSYLKERNAADTLKIGTNFPADWFFRNEKWKISYFPYNDRSLHDWDYYIAANSYIPPALLRNKNWPPENSIKIIEADGVPVCTILKRENRNDFLGSRATVNNHFEDAVRYFEEAVKNNCRDELIFFNFASVCYNLGDTLRAKTLLQKGLEINPECESILMFQANIFCSEGNSGKAADLYQEVIRLNRKYFDAYLALAKIRMNQKELKQARVLLKSCLMIHPGFREAIICLADTYRTSDPEVAGKYDELAKTIQ